MRKKTIVRDYPAITVSIKRRVRFEEVDSISFMWHGRYASWLEDGREALGTNYGISYNDFHANQVQIPLKTFALDFISPLRYSIDYNIITSLLWNEATLLEFEYEILDCEQKIMTKASTIQLMTNQQGKLLLESPNFYKVFCEKWKQNKV